MSNQDGAHEDRATLEAEVAELLRQMPGMVGRSTDDPERAAWMARKAELLDRIEQTAR